MAENATRVEILEMIKRGDISAEEGLRLMNAIKGQGEVGGDSGRTESFLVSPDQMESKAGSGQPALPAHGQVLPSSDLHGLGEEPSGTQTARSVTGPPSKTEEDYARDEALRAVARWKRWWQLPFWFGVGVIVVSSWWMYLGYFTAGFSWGFWLSWFPFLAGLLLMVAAWRSSTARWLHVRVNSIKGSHTSRIAFSMPLPLRLAVWTMRKFGRYIPEVRDQDLGSILDTLDQSISSDEPVYIHVNGDDGDEVEVFIG